MFDTFKHLWIWVCMIAISTIPAYCTLPRCPISCGLEDCAVLDDSCTCRGVEPVLSSVVCSKWSAQPFSLKTVTTSYLPNFIINGLNGTISSKFLEWFVPKAVSGLERIHSYDISNFCNDPSKITNHLNISKIIGQTYNPPFSNTPRIKMSHNCLQSITGSFSPGFQELDFSFNILSEIPKFRNGTDHLIKYDLSHNNLGIIARTDFNKTFKLEQLNLSHNNLSSLPQDLLLDLQFLEILDLSHNSISSIPDTFLHGNLLLKKFDISRNQIYRIPDTLFINSRSLVEFNFSNNTIKTFRLDTSNLKNLQVVRLESNNMTFVAFKGLSNNKDMKEITLANNSISGYASLDTHDNFRFNFKLNLSNNNFTILYLPLTIFISNAETLDISNNCFLRVVWPIEMPLTYPDHKILNFICRNCCLRTIFSDRMFDKVTNKVDISFNDIKELGENTLKSFQHIPNVILSHNKITHVNLTQFEITNKGRFVNFDLSHNPFMCDCRLNRFIKYLHNQNANFTFSSTRNNFCAHPPEMNGTALNTIQNNLFCEYPTNCPSGCYCSVNDIETFSYVLIVCNNSNLTHFPKINSYGPSVALQLNLSRNKISSLPDKHDPIWSQITSLDLSYNQLKSLKSMPVLPNLSTLYLNDNFLTEFDATILSFTHLSEIRLANNPWKCDCEMSKVVLKSPLFHEKYEWFCENGITKYNVTDIDQICKKFNLLWLLLPIITLVIFPSVIAVLFYKYRSEIVYYMFSKGICLKFVSEEDVDADKVYDAFVSYSNEDEDWITDFLVPGLETGVPSYKLCLHNRDWSAGEFITDQIVRSVESSRRTIIVLTDDYLNSLWSRFEFDVAYQQGLKDRVRRVIVVVPNQVPDLSKVDQEFKSFITLTTYVQAKKPYFWRKLRASMPRRKNTLVPAVRSQSVYLNASFTENSD